MRRLTAAALALLFLSWVGYLVTLTQLPKTPVVPRAQLMAADLVLRAALDGGPTAKVVAVLRSRLAEPPKVGDALAVDGLPTARGFAGPGEYLVTLRRGDGAYALAAAPEMSAAEKPWVTPWGESAERQLAGLLPP